VYKNRKITKIPGKLTLQPKIIESTNPSIPPSNETPHWKPPTASGWRGEQFAVAESLESQRPRGPKEEEEEEQ